MYRYISRYKCRYILTPVVNLNGTQKWISHLLHFIWYFSFLFVCLLVLFVRINFLGLFLLSKQLFCIVVCVFPFSCCCLFCIKLWRIYTYLCCTKKKRKKKNPFCFLDFFLLWFFLFSADSEMLITNICMWLLVS